MNHSPIERPRRQAPLLTVLFTSLMLLLLVGPLFPRTVFGLSIPSILFSLVAAAGVAVSARSRVTLWMSVFLVLPMLVAVWTAPVVAMASFTAASLGLRAVFFMFLCVAILTRVLRDQVVSLETIAGAASVYLLFGVAWACLFGLVERLQPGALFIPEDWRGQAAMELTPLEPLLYFSFTTLTTVGYGDIHASSPVAANLAVTEAIMGQLYLTVLVARLVGLQIVQSERSRQGDGSPQ